jgi:hypothetical protein
MGVVGRGVRGFEWELIMKRLLAVAVGAMVLALPVACKSEPKANEPEKPLTYEDSVSGSVSAKVKAVSASNRTITLQDDKGEEETFYVDKAVKRLDEVKPGDSIKLEYKAVLTGELRPPTAEEKAHPIEIVSVSGKAPATSAPAAGAGRGVRIVTTVEAVDVPNMKVTLRGPLGDLAVVKGKKQENVKKLKVGDTIVITYVDAAAMSVVKGK